MKKYLFITCALTSVALIVVPFCIDYFGVAGPAIVVCGIYIAIITYNQFRAYRSKYKRDGGVVTTCVAAAVIVPAIIMQARGEEMLQGRGPYTFLAMSLFLYGLILSVYKFSQNRIAFENGLFGNPNDRDQQGNSRLK